MFSHHKHFFHIFSQSHHSHAHTLRLVSPSRLAVVMWQVPSARSDDSKIRSAGNVSSLATRTMSPTWMGHQKHTHTYVTTIYTQFNSSYLTLFNFAFRQLCKISTLLSFFAIVLFWCCLWVTHFNSNFALPVFNSQTDIQQLLTAWFLYTIHQLKSHLQSSLFVLSFS